MKKLEILIGKVQSTEELGIVLFLKGKSQKGFCKWEDLSDFKKSCETLSIVGTELKVCNLKKFDSQNRLLVSYRYIHPQEQHKKNKIIPTASHFINLHTNLKSSLMSINFFAKSTNNLKTTSFKDLNDKR